MKYQEWRDILNKAINDNLTGAQVERMVDESNTWQTCAVGAKLMCDLNLDRLKDETMVSKYISFNIDNNVRRKGLNIFPSQVKNGDYGSALKTLDEIYDTLDIHKSWWAKQKFKWNQWFS